MPDISMCQDDECPVRVNCRRHKDSGTKPSSPQWYAGFRHKSKNGCDDFWPVPKRKKADDKGSVD